MDQQILLSSIGTANWGLALLLLVLGIIFVFGLRISKKGEWHTDYLSLPISKGLQGFCAILIVLHHASQALAEQAGPLAVLENIGVCFVGIFFFFSGYGLLKSLKVKPDYLHHFFRKRLPVILIPFYMITILFFIFYLILEETFSPLELFCYLSGWWLLNSHMWYIVEIFILYLLFFLLFHLCQKRATAIFIMGIFVIAMTIGSLLLGHGDYWFQGEWWFNTTFLFVIGMLVAEHEEKFNSFIQHFYPVVLIITAALTLLLHHATDYMLNTYSYWSETDSSMAYCDKFRCLSVQLPFVICFVLLLLVITMKVQFHNPILNFLGSISLELYLIHNMFLELFFYICPIESPVLFTVIVLVCALIAATLLHVLDQKLIKLFKTKLLPN